MGSSVMLLVLRASNVSTQLRSSEVDQSEFYPGLNRSIHFSLITYRENWRLPELVKAEVRLQVAGRHPFMCLSKSAPLWIAANQIHADPMTRQGHEEGLSDNVESWRHP